MNVCDWATICGAEKFPRSCIRSAVFSCDQKRHSIDSLRAYSDGTQDAYTCRNDVVFAARCAVVDASVYLYRPAANQRTQCHACVRRVVVITYITAGPVFRVPRVRSSSTSWNETSRPSHAVRHDTPDETRRQQIDKRIVHAGSARRKRRSRCPQGRVQAATARSDGYWSTDTSDVAAAAAAVVTLSPGHAMNYKSTDLIEWSHRHITAHCGNQELNEYLMSDISLLDGLWRSSLPQQPSPARITNALNPCPSLVVSTLIIRRFVM